MKAENPKEESKKSQKIKGQILYDGKIDLIEFTKVIWSGRFFIIKGTSLFIIFGLIIAFTTAVEYEASTKLLPESTHEDLSSNLGGLGGLAGLAGIDLGAISSGSGSLSPHLYPEIVNSLPFVLDVMSDTIFFEKNNIHTTSLYYFENIDRPSLLGYTLKYTIGLPTLINEVLKGSDEPANEMHEFYRFNKQQWKRIQEFRDRIEVNIDSETNLISIKVLMPDAYAAAVVAKKVTEMITNEVVKYQTEKAEENLRFVLKAFNDAKIEFEIAQNLLAEAMDRNQNIISARGEIELRRLENKYNLAFEVYKGLASQVEEN
ncbi:Wzz/FepE/Etk N-terminal domain-containing protein [Ekhidna sp.]|uniref:Wzz/FepE/Etk N-terminal domain-containing protein n=1 Tax=Ekhidna sp. TaxID=2608089 RepID=UPI003BAA45E2